MTKVYFFCIKIHKTTHREFTFHEIYVLPFWIFENLKINFDLNLKYETMHFAFHILFLNLQKNSLKVFPLQSLPS